MGLRVGAAAEPRNVILASLFMTTFGVAETTKATGEDVDTERIATGVEDLKEVVVEPNTCARLSTLPAGDALRKVDGAVTGLTGVTLTALVTASEQGGGVAAVLGFVACTIGTLTGVTIGGGSEAASAAVSTVQTKLSELHKCGATVQASVPLESRCACTTFLAAEDA